MADNVIQYNNASQQSSSIRRTFLLIQKTERKFLETPAQTLFLRRFFCNLPGLTASLGDRVRFHTLAIGTENDLHTPNWGGGISVLRQGGKRSMSFGLLSGIAQSADTVADVRGSWVYHCAVHDHQNAGMQALYEVV